MTLSLDKLISVVVFIVMGVVSTLVLGPTGGQLAGPVIAFTMLTPGLVLIWFSEALAETACFSRGTVSSSPPLLVAAFGWLYLVGYPVLLYFVLA